MRSITIVILTLWSFPLSAQTPWPTKVDFTQGIEIGGGVLLDTVKQDGSDVVMVTDIGSFTIIDKQVVLDSLDSLRTGISSVDTVDHSLTSDTSGLSEQVILSGGTDGDLLYKNGNRIGRSGLLNYNSTSTVLRLEANSGVEPVLRLRNNGGINGEVRLFNTGVESWMAMTGPTAIKLGSTGTGWLEARSDGVDINTTLVLSDGYEINGEGDLGTSEFGSDFSAATNNVVPYYDTGDDSLKFDNNFYWDDEGNKLWVSPGLSLGQSDEIQFTSATISNTGNDVVINGNLSFETTGYISNIDSTEIGDIWYDSTDFAGFGGESVSIGLDNQIPITNASGDDFEYTNDFRLIDNGLFLRSPTSSTVMAINNSNMTGMLSGAQYNTFVGISSGNSITSGDQNSFFGYSSGGNVTTGLLNTIVGYNSGLSITSGDNNTLLGASAGASITGNNNTAIGSSALLNSSGSNNTVVGYAAGNSNTGSSNVFIGYNAGYNASGSNLLFIDNSNTATPLIYGEFNNDSLNINGNLNVTGTIYQNGIPVGTGGGSSDSNFVVARIDTAKALNNSDIYFDNQITTQSNISMSSAGAIVLNNNSGNTMTLSDFSGTMSATAPTAFEWQVIGSNYLNWNGTDLITEAGETYATESFVDTYVRDSIGYFVDTPFDPNFNADNTEDTIVHFGFGNDSVPDGYMATAYILGQAQTNDTIRVYSNSNAIEFPVTTAGGNVSFKMEVNFIRNGTEMIQQIEITGENMSTDAKWTEYYFDEVGAVGWSSSQTMTITGQAEDGVFSVVGYWAETSIRRGFK